MCWAFPPLIRSSSFTLVQQSVAFKILRTRIKTVPSFAPGSARFERAAPWNLSPAQRALDEIMADQETENAHESEIDFAARLEQFERMQRRHRAHAKSQMQSRNLPSSKLSQVPPGLPHFSSISSSWKNPSLNCLFPHLGRSGNPEIRRAPPALLHGRDQPAPFPVIVAGRQPVPIIGLSSWPPESSSSSSSSG